MHKLTREERSFELERHKAVLLETINYILQDVAAEKLEPDVFQSISEYYNQQKQQIEKNFEERKLSVLQRRLVTLTKWPMRKADLSFNSYIKLRTGYDIDIFENLRKQVKTIIDEKQIIHKKQLSDISIMIEVYKQIPNESLHAEILKDLILDFFNREKLT